jgi:hypothetical protein
MDYWEDKSVRECVLCQGSGFLDSGATCSCLVNFRVRVMLLAGKFAANILNFVSASYSLPVVESGEKYLTYFLQNTPIVVTEGLSLYVFSREAGRGKTTLAHYLAVKFAEYYSTSDHYKRGVSFGFDNVNDLIDKEMSFDNDDPYWKRMLYVLDDFGNEDRSAKRRREFFVPMMQRILHHRQDNHLPTIITSNYSPGSIDQLYSGRLNSLLEIQVDGSLGGNLFRSVELGGGEDLRTLNTS